MAQALLEVFTAILAILSIPFLAGLLKGGALARRKRERM